MTYLFKCENCKEIEVTMSYKDLPLTKCPKCGNENIERIYSPITSVWNCDGAFGKSSGSGGES